MKHRLIGAFAALVLIAALAGAVAASAAKQAVGTVTVVASDLNNPRHVSASPSGAIYVAEAGRAGPACQGKGEDATCFGRSGAIGIYKNGGYQRVVKGLWSIGGQDGSFTVGPDGVSVTRYGHFFVAMTGAPCDIYAGLNASQKSQIGRLLKQSYGRVKALANLNRLECQNNYDKTDRNPNPYGVLAVEPNEAIIADAGANVVYKWRNGHTRVLAVLPQNGKNHSVPTSVAMGPDGYFYVGELVGEAEKEPRKNLARVFRIHPQTGALTVYATGFNNISGLTFDRQGNMYVTELSIHEAFEDPRGDVIRVAPDGTRTTFGLGKLFFPAGAAIGADGHLYVSNWSVLPASTPKNSPFKGAGGQLVRIQLH